MACGAGHSINDMKPASMPIPSSKTRLVYILSASHSGSTLLALLLNAHPEICTVGELKASSLGDVERYRCSCRRTIRECPFWNRITEEMAKRGMEFDIAQTGTDFRFGASPYALKLLQPLFRGGVFEWLRDMLLRLSPRWRTQLPIIQSKNAALMGTVLSQAKKKVIVDSSKLGLRLKFLLKNPQLDIKILRLVRDGRAVSLTYMDPARFADAQRVEFRGGGHGGDRNAERLTLEQAAREWRRSNEEAEALLGSVDRTRWMEVRYETLCREPENTLKGIFAFIDVDRSCVNLDFRSAEHHIIGNGMRLDSSNQIKTDERWRLFLTESQVSIFDQLAGSMNRSLGYR
jgi:hypothetical protein